MGDTRNSSIIGVDLFCGAGGLTNGLIQGGVDIRAGLDLDPACRYPYEANNPSTFYQRDVNDVTACELRSLYDKPGVSLLAGCAPCQPFSSYAQGERGRKRGRDWQLVARFGELVEGLRPDLVTMENVPQLTGHEVFDDFLTALEGYSVKILVVECVKIGIPQSRRRLVLLASRFGGQGLDLSHAYTSDKRTVRQEIECLPPIEAGGYDPDDRLHTSSNLSDTNMLRMLASKEGGTWRDWDPELVAACHRKSTGSTYPSVYGRMEWDQPAPTITTQFFGFGNGRFGHPDQNRAISLREAAMLQTFPREYKFVPEDAAIRFNQLGRLIGNAVPVRLGRVIGETLNRHLAIVSGELEDTSDNDLGVLFS